MNTKEPRFVENLFNSIAPNYDLLNDLFSFGLHRLWKRRLIKLLNPLPGENWLDLCCGTGDLAINIERYVRPNGSVLGIDSASKVLQIAKERSTNKSLKSLSWLKGDVTDTNLPNNSFDGAVMAYGLRNLSDPYKAIKEIKRILKPGASAGILDFNKKKKGSLGAKFQTLYLRNLVVPAANLINIGAQYAYIEKSLNSFFSGQEQETIALDAGFKKAKHIPISFGQMGILLVNS